MIPLSIFQTIEFYVIASLLAAAVIAYAARPSDKGPARTFLYAGTLMGPCDDPQASAPAGIVAEVNPSGTLTINRYGLDGIHATGAYSLAVKIIGYDVSIEERLTAGAVTDVLMSAATATVDCLAPEERYHIRYNSERTGTFTAFTLTLRPGSKVMRRLDV